MSSSAIALALTACAGGTTYVDRAEARYPPIGQFLDVEGGRVHYIEGGAGPTLILVHGANGNIRDWTFSMFARLAETHHVIAFDRPGLGYSDRAASDGDNPEVQARILSAAAAQLGVKDAVIVGHSWGGAVVMAWALNHAEQVGGVAVLAGATYPWGGDGVFVYKLGAAEALSGVVNGFARSYITENRSKDYLADVFHPNDAPAGYVDYIGVGLALRPDTFKWNAQDIARLDGHLARMAPRYGEIAVPMEIMHGSEDQAVLGDIHSMPLHRDVRDSYLTILPGVGHMLHHIEEDQVIEAIERLTHPA